MRGYMVERKSIEFQKTCQGSNLVYKTGLEFVLIMKFLLVYWETVKLIKNHRTGSIAISRRPNPCLSGREGWAPTATPYRLASKTVLSMTVKSLSKKYITKFWQQIDHSRRVKPTCNIREMDMLHERFIITLYMMLRWNIRVIKNFSSYYGVKRETLFKRVQRNSSN